MPRIFPGIAVQIPAVLLPGRQIDPAKWAVIACDQFTSQPDYWQSVQERVGDSASTLNLVLPEVYLHTDGKPEAIGRIHRSMQQYLEQDLFQPVEGMIYVERTFHGSIRRGLILALDLEQYHFDGVAPSLIRATEGTIPERLSLRIELRQGSALELPHTLVLIDDPGRTVIEPVTRVRSHLERLYDFELMMDSGRLSGWLVDDPEVEAGIIRALLKLAQPEAFTRKYGVNPGGGVMLYAVGDGNHSLAAAKVLWEELKRQPGMSMDHPARYALVEVQNLHEEALCFEPIHRVLYGLKGDLSQALSAYFGERVSLTPCQSEDALVEMVEQVDRMANAQTFGIVTTQAIQVAQIASPECDLPVSSVQAFLNSLVKLGQVERIDYVHGADVAYQVGMQPGNAGFYLPLVAKEHLFRTIIRDGALPLKTFSIGEARQKRFYMESRKITL